MRSMTNSMASKSSQVCRAPSWCAMMTAPMKKGSDSKLLACAALARALANSFEALPFFIGAVIIAQQLAAPQALLDALAAGFIALRVAYIALYVADRALARSAVWALALLINMAIFFIGFR